MLLLLLLLFFSFFFFFYLWNFFPVTRFLVTPLLCLVTPHPEVEKQEMLLRHAAQDFLKASGPNKGLFGNRSVEPGKFLL